MQWWLKTCSRLHLHQSTPMSWKYRKQWTEILGWATAAPFRVCDERVNESMHTHRVGQPLVVSFTQTQSLLTAWHVLEWGTLGYKHRSGCETLKCAELFPDIRVHSTTYRRYNTTGLHAHVQFECRNVECCTWKVDNIIQSHSAKQPPLPLLVHVTPRAQESTRAHHLPQMFLRDDWFI